MSAVCWITKTLQTNRISGINGFLREIQTAIKDLGDGNEYTLNRIQINLHFTPSEKDELHWCLTGKYLHPRSSCVDE